MLYHFLGIKLPLGKNDVAYYATSFMLLLHSLWERVLLIQQMILLSAA